MENEVLMPELPERSLIDQLVDIKILIDTKQRFTTQELKKIYDMYNFLTGEKKQPNGCSACLNATLTRLKKECRANGI
jgi:hypothetical protein